MLLGFGVVFELFMLFTAWWFTVRKYRCRWGALGSAGRSAAAGWLPIGLLLGGLAIILVYFGAPPACRHRARNRPAERRLRQRPAAIVMLVLTVILAPVVEEIFFRGFVFGGLRGAGAVMRRWPAACSSASRTSATPATSTSLPPIVAIGAMFAWGYFYTGSIVAGMIAHFLFNLVQRVVGHGLIVMTGRIEATFERLKAEGRTGFVAFVTVGYPEIESTPRLVQALVDGGADIIELGMPFSDPLAEGPTIQAPRFRALENGVDDGRPAWTRCGSCGRAA